MAVKYHINSNNEAKICRASVRACRFSADQHYENETEALQESERRLAIEFSNFATVTTKKDSPSKVKSPPKSKIPPKTNSISNDDKTSVNSFKDNKKEFKNPPKTKATKNKTVMTKDNASLPQINNSEESFTRLPESAYSLKDITALRDYRNGANWSINRGLREGKELSSRSHEAMVTLDKIINNSPTLEKPTVVQRSLDTGGGNELKIPGKGEVYSDPAFLSCSTNGKYIEETIKKGVDEYSDYPSDTILSIELPKGSKAFALPNEDMDYIEEAEVLLPRNSKMMIVEDSGFVDGVRRVRARLIVD